MPVFRPCFAAHPAASWSSVLSAGRRYPHSVAPAVESSAEAVSAHPFSTAGSAPVAAPSDNRGSSNEYEKKKKELEGKTKKKIIELHEIIKGLENENGMSLASTEHKSRIKNFGYGDTTIKSVVNEIFNALQRIDLNLLKDEINCNKNLNNIKTQINEITLIELRQTYESGQKSIYSRGKVITKFSEYIEKYYKNEGNKWRLRVKRGRLPGRYSSPLVETDGVGATGGAICTAGEGTAC